VAKATGIPSRIGMAMKRFLAPVSLGLSAARHLAWYISYQLSGQARDERD